MVKDLAGDVGRDGSYNSDCDLLKLEEADI